MRGIGTVVAAGVGLAIVIVGFAALTFGTDVTEEPTPGPDPTADSVRDSERRGRRVSRHVDVEALPELADVVFWQAGDIERAARRAWDGPVRRVVLRKPDGSPLPSHPVSWRARGRSGRLVSDDDGVLRLPDLPGLTVKSMLPSLITFDGRNEARVDAGVPLRVEVVDATTGLPRQAPFVCIDTHRHQANDLWLTPGTRVTVNLSLPDGLVPHEVTIPRTHAARAVVKGYRLVIPLRPEAVLGSPHTGGASPRSHYSVRRSYPAELTERGDGVVRGVPWFDGERVRVRAGDPPTAAFVILDRGHRGDTPSHAVRLYPESGRRGGRSHGWSRGDSWSRSRGTTYEWVVHAQFADGRPAANVRLSTGDQTDDEGRAVLQSSSPVALRVGFDEPGVLPSPRIVPIEERNQGPVVLREERGRGLTIYSRTDQGRPLPFARVELRGPKFSRWTHVDEHGIQDLALWTDAGGRLELERVPESGIRVTVRYGSRSGSVEVAADEDVAVVKLPALR